MSATIIEDNDVYKARMLAQRTAAKLECLGMKHSSGKSMLAHIKREYGIKGKTKVETYRNFYKHVEAVVFDNHDATPDIDENGNSVKRERRES